MLAGRAAARSAGSSPPAGSSRCTTGRWPDGQRRGGRRRRRGRRRARAGDDGRARGAARRPRRARRRRAGDHAGATIAAGGKRLRPLLAASPPGAEPGAPELRSCARRVAVELVHSATLVHDDVLDAARAAARAPDGGRRRGPGDGGRHGRPAVLARVRRAGRRRRAEAIRSCPTRRRRWSQGELLQREDAWNVNVTRERYERRCELKTARLFRAACELGALRGRRRRRAARRLRRSHRAGVPAARRRASFVSVVASGSRSLARTGQGKLPWSNSSQGSTTNRRPHPAGRSRS